MEHLEGFYVENITELWPGEVATLSGGVVGIKSESQFELRCWPWSMHIWSWGIEVLSSAVQASDPSSGNAEEQIFPRLISKASIYSSQASEKPDCSSVVWPQVLSPLSVITTGSA